MPRNLDIKKVLVIGSGPIVIGQAAEFDYAGTQACRSLKEEGVEVVLVNSNPATIMTDKEIADEVYIEPLTAKVLEQIILKEKPDSVLPTLGGQAGLNLGMELEESGFLKEHGVRLIGTTAETIFRAEDRQAFKDTMEKLAGSSPYAVSAADAAAVIVACFRTEGLIYPELVYMDMSACVENMLIEITAQGLGGVWLSIAPYEDRMQNVDEILGIGDGLRSFALIPVGYPEMKRTVTDRYDKNRVHDR